MPVSLRIPETVKRRVEKRAQAQQTTAHAFMLEAIVVAIDHKACIAFGPDCKEVCVEKCPRKIFRYYRPAAKQAQAAVGS